MGLPHPTINWESPALKEAWTKFEQHARLMFAGPLSDKTQPQRVSYLLLWVGEKGRDIFSTFNFAPAVPAVPAVPAAGGVAAMAAVAAIAGEDQNDLDTVCRKFKEYVTPKSSVIFARYRFYNRVQAAHESVDSFVTDGKLLAKDCGFPADIVDKMIRDRLVYGTNSHKVRERFINRGTDLDLLTALNIARAYESAQSQLKKMTGEAAQVQVIKSDRRNTRKGPASGKKGGTNGATSANKSDGKAIKPGNTGQQCGNCGYAPHSSTDQCPARGKRCGKCGKKNHFAALCRQKTVHTVEDANIDSDDSEDFYIECVHSTTHKDQAFVELTCNGTKMPFKIDTGAQVNVLPISDFDKLSIKQPLTQSTVTLRGYGGRELDTLGMCDLNCTYKDINRNLQFHVVNSTSSSRNIRTYSTGSGNSQANTHSRYVWTWNLSSTRHAGYQWPSATK